MPKREKHAADNNQSQKFVDFAREVGADDSDKAFRRAVRKIGEYRPEKDQKDDKPPGALKPKSESRKKKPGQ